MPDMLFILLLALVIFGPKKLPELARQLGKYRAQFKQMQRELTNQLETEMSNIRSTEIENSPSDSSERLTADGRRLPSPSDIRHSPT
jgi:TatA/E family protein of Tat protein translocase